jgi:PAS domain S-box-containing protein
MTRVLIVDDKDENLYYLEALLSANGCAVVTARHGAEALVKARQQRPDLVISDLLMPVMDGYTLLRHWKADPNLRAVPFIVYTATYTEVEDERLAYGLGADAFILKPAEPEDFLARLRDVQANAAAPAPTAPRTPDGNEEAMLQVYSETLIRKLEEKSLQLEHANDKLQLDLAERKDVESALRKSEEEFRLLVETLPHMVWVTRADGWVVHYNAKWMEWTGMSVEDSLGYGWIDALHPDDRARAALAWQEATEKGEPYAIEYRLRTADSAYCWVLARALPLHDAAGNILKWFGTCTDIDELKRAYARISEQASLLDHAAEAILVRNLEHRITYWNKGAERLYGWTAAEALGKSVFSLLGPDDHAAIHQQLERVLADGTWSGEVQRRSKAGDVLTVETNLTLLRDEFNLPRAILSINRDITDRRLLEEQLRQSQRLESVGQLTGGLAHDFNNLLTVILGNAEMLSEELAGDPRLAEPTSMVVDAAQRGAKLTQRLLAFARKQTLEPRTVDAQELVTGMDPLLRRTLGEHIEIVSTRGRNLWPALVDPAQLENALLNLCINARDAMPGGGQLTIETANVTLERDYTDQHPDVQPGQYVMLAVSDTGSGIPPEVVGRVFEPFFTTKVKGKGTGLGLAMVYGFIKQSGGHVAIYSEADQGTTVKLYLPRSSAAVDAPAEPVAHVRTIHGGTETVLLVEDDELVRRYAHSQLKALGYEVIVVPVGAQAMDVIRSDAHIDLLFTDVVMPGGMGGRDLAEQAQAVRPGLRVLYTSGYTEDAIVHHGRLDPGVNLLTKPYGRTELAERVRAALDQ